MDGAGVDGDGVAGVALRLREAVLGGAVDPIAAVLDEEVRFFSPAFAEPAVGRERVAGVLAVAGGVYEGLVFGEPLVDGTSAVVFFDARVEGRPLQGCYRLDVAAGRVTRLDALMRPLDAVQALVATMMRRTAPGGGA